MSCDTWNTSILRIRFASFSKCAFLMRSTRNSQDGKINWSHDGTVTTAQLNGIGNGSGGIKSVIRVWSLFNGFSCQKKCCTDLIYPNPRSSLVSLLRNLSPVPRCTDRTTKTAKSFTQSNFACRRTKSRSNEKWCALCRNETCEMIIILLQLA